MNTMIPHPPFTRLTSRLDSFLFSLQPCARALCTWLHRLYYSDRLRNGDLIVDLTEFEEYSADRVRAPYTIRWIRRCYVQLVERGFIVEIRKLSANLRKIRLVNPDEVAPLESDPDLNSPEMALKNPNCTFKATLGHSNPHSLVAESRSGDFKPSIAIEDEQVGASSNAQTPLEQKDELLNRAREIGAELTPALIQAIARATAQQVANAIARVKEHLDAGGHIKKSVAAFLNFAIQNEAYPNSQRKRSSRSSSSPVPPPATAATPPPATAATPPPEPPPEPPKKEAPPEPPEMPEQLMEWYELAHYCKACLGYRFNDGDWQFYCPPEKWINWEAATAMWSLKRLQRDKAQLDSATKSS